jgi:hypothetical protein
MDPVWVAEANAIVDKYQHTVTYPDPVAASDQVRGTVKMQGTGRPGMDIMRDITDETDRAPFVKMLAHPALVQRLNWMCGGHFRTEHLGSVIMSRRGTGGQILHGNGDPVYPNISWWDCELRPAFILPCAQALVSSLLRVVDTYDNGRLHTGQINVAWQLHDVTDSEGGFVRQTAAFLHSFWPLPLNYFRCSD